MIWTFSQKSSVVAFAIIALVLASVVLFFRFLNDRPDAFEPIEIPGLASTDASELVESFSYASKKPLPSVALRFETRRAPLGFPELTFPYDTVSLPDLSDSGTETQYLCGMVQGSLIGNYRYVSVFDAAGKGRATAGVRWKNGFPDILLDFVGPDSVTIVKADRGEPAEVSPPVVVGENVYDFLAGIERLRQYAVAEAEDVVVCVIKKSVTSITAIRMRALGTEFVTLGATKIEPGEAAPGFKCRKYAVHLAYGCPVTFTADMSLADLRRSHFPEQSVSDVSLLLAAVTGVSDPKTLSGRTYALPVSPAIYNRVMSRDRDFDAPFGLDDSLIIWCDVRTGMPVRIQGEFHGVAVAFELIDSKSIVLD